MSLHVVRPVHRSAFGCIGALVLAACGPESPRAGAPVAVAPVAVRVARVVRAPFERSVAAVGELQPFERATLATKVPGRLAELVADRGDTMRRGDVLARLEAREYELRAQAAEAAVATARAVLGLPEEAGARDEVDPEATAAVRLARAQLERSRLALERSRQLANEGVDSKSALDAAEADHRVAESRLQEAFELVASRAATLAQRRAELEIARAQLAETRILAPFDGRIELRLAATGAYLGVGDGVYEVVRDPLRLVLEVSERDAHEVRAGQLVRATVAGVERELGGPIRRLAPALTREGRALLAEVELADPDGELRPGAFAEARILVQTEELALTIPLEAVTSFAGLDKALVVEEGSARARRLELGRRAGGRVEVRAGLAEGESVVLAPGTLAPGSPVKVAE
jgi:RND family efflux transporter MFP subunit